MNITGKEEEKSMSATKSPDRNEGVNKKTTIQRPDHSQEKAIPASGLVLFMLKNLKN